MDKGQRKYQKFVLATMAMILACSNLPAYGLARKAPALQEKHIQKTAALLERSGYSYKKNSESVWSVDFNGKALPSFKVIFAAQSGLLVVAAIIARKDEIHIGPELLRKLLGFNHRLDRVKVGLDDDGDLFVRVDLTPRVLDDEEFKANVEQLAAAADEVYAGIKSLLK